MSSGDLCSCKSNEGAKLFMDSAVKRRSGSIRIEKRRVRNMLRELAIVPDAEEVVVSPSLKRTLLGVSSIDEIDGSPYRGVSRNGKKWQALIMSQKRKRYLGSREDEVSAARLFDCYSILLHGLKVRSRGT